ncbi:MAG: hypothetical protein IPK16_09320 [Anaerolineales bacterium]|nr:hypothetical protein [Anaerolineales bacterium]
MTPLFPTCHQRAPFLRIMDGIAVAAYHDLTALQEQSGNPQEQVDWSEPDAWIPVRLAGEVRTLAERIWHASHRQLNPRYTRGCWYLAFKHGLLSRRYGEIVRLTERGQQFFDKPDSGLEVEIDAYEGVLVILHLVAEHGAARRSDLLPGYAQFCRSETTTASDNFIKTTLYDRLRNLIDCGFVLAWAPV